MSSYCVNVVLIFIWEETGIRPQPQLPPLPNPNPTQLNPHLPSRTHARTHAHTLPMRALLYVLLYSSCQDIFLTPVVLWDAVMWLPQGGHSCFPSLIICQGKPIVTKTSYNKICSNRHSKLISIYFSKTLISICITNKPKCIAYCFPSKRTYNVARTHGRFIPIWKCLSILWDLRSARSGQILWLWPWYISAKWISCRNNSPICLPGKMHALASSIFHQNWLQCLSTKTSLIWQSYFTVSFHIRIYAWKMFSRNSTIPMGSFHGQESTLILSWISKCFHYKVWDAIIHESQNSNGADVIKCGMKVHIVSQISKEHPFQDVQWLQDFKRGNR